MASRRPGRSQASSAMFLSNLSIKRPVFATVLMLSLVTLGIASYRRLALDLYPQVEIAGRLENVSGVGKVDRIGAIEREVAIEIRPERLESLGLGVDEVVGGLARENVDAPLGRLTGPSSEAPLRVQGKARSIDDFRAMAIAARGGRPIALGEVADVTDGEEEAR